MATQTESAERQDELHTKDDLSFDLNKRGIGDQFVDDQTPSKKPKSENMVEQSEFDRKGEKGHETLENIELGISKSDDEFGGLNQMGRRGSYLGKEAIVMNSEDESDEELLDEYYGEETTMPSDDDDDDDDGFYGMDNDNDDSVGLRRQQNCTILSEDDIRTNQEEDISKLSTVLSISKVSASILLRHYNWSVSNVNDAWFADEEKVRTAVGLLEKPISRSSNTNEITCGICFENYLLSNMSAAICGHFFCIDCWQGYISTSIKDGPGCLMLRCPDPPCGVALDQDMIYQLVSDEDKVRYDRYLLRSYIEDNRKIKWCPAPDCDFAVEFSVGSESYDVSCKCTYSFCWNCLEEAHRPVDCDTVAKWKLKNSAESENTNWILAYSKPCPKCKRPIEKNKGCMHMTCTPPCRYQFCWLCLGDWSAHFKETGRPNACNGYKEKEDGPKDEDGRRREMARKLLQRYAHYYERWAANEKSRQKAFEDLQIMQSVHIERLSNSQCQLRSQLKFLSEAWLQIIECRRVLKWTYAYGYYLPEDEYAKRQLFEYLQGQAESGLERLHQCAEQDLQVYLNAEGPSNGFNEFRSKLAGLTSVTRNYFQNLVDALENGLADVDSNGACSKMCNPEGFEGDKKRKRGRTKSVTFDGRGQGLSTFFSAGPGQDPGTFFSAGPGQHPGNFFLAGHGQDPATIFSVGRVQNVLGAQSHRGTNSEADGVVRRQIQVRRRPDNSTTSSGAAHVQEDSTVPWSCVHCTYVNDKSATVCQICNQQSGSWSCQECTYVNIRSDPICTMCQHQR